MTDRRKRKQRKKRITDLEDLGLVPGKLYSFQGRFRYLYKEQKAEWRRNHTKIQHGDYVIFLKADLWESEGTKTNLVCVASKKAAAANLVNKGYTVVSTKRSYWNTNSVCIRYKSKDTVYSGMLYIGFGDKFGWVNIVQMSNKAILKQFNKVKLGNDKS